MNAQDVGHTLAPAGSQVPAVLHDVVFAATHLARACGRRHLEGGGDAEKRGVVYGADEFELLDKI